MKEVFKAIGVVLIVIAVLFLFVSCNVWEWNECRGVGHGVAYCLMKHGE